MMDRDEVRELLADITDPMLDTFEQMRDFLNAMPEGAERDKIFRRTAAVMERLKKGLPIKHWELLEVSLVTVPAESSAHVRHQDDLHDRIYLPTLPACLADIRCRMEIRQRIMERPTELESHSDTHDAGGLYQV